MAKKKDKNHFRFNRITKHPTYIYAKDGNDYKFIGLTHAKITQGTENIPLSKNPNPKDLRQSYARPFSDRKPKATFGKRLKGWSLDEGDRATMNAIRKKK